MYNFHQVKEVSPLNDCKLRILFQDGVEKEYDVTTWFDRKPVFLELKENPDLFFSVKVDTGGYGISWSDDIDLHCNELWENGIAI